MGRIDDIFDAKQAAGEKALMPFLCAGRPSLEALPDLLAGVESAGASIVELGFPFSDPIADGPVIAAAMHRALEEGVTVDAIFNAVEKARPTLKLGLVAMVTVSIVTRWGAERFLDRAAEAGFDGCIFPDAPLEEAESLVGAAGERGLTASLLISPTTTDDRAVRIAALSTGFVYLVARIGITGERSETPDIGARVAALRSITDLPIACGFGVSTSEHVRAVVEHADAAIVGSSLVHLIEKASGAGADPVAQGARFVEELAAGLHASSLNR